MVSGGVGTKLICTALIPVGPALTVPEPVGVGEFEQYEVKLVPLIEIAICREAPAVQPP